MRAAFFAFALVLVAFPQGLVTSDGGPDAIEGKRRISLLRERVLRWVEVRGRPAVSKCALCGGEGVRHRIERDSRGNVLGTHDEICTQCNGQRSIVDWDNAKRAHWDVRSPAYRAVAANEAAFKSMVNGWLASPSTEPVLRRYRIGDAFLTGDRYGVVKLFENGSTGATDTRWVWSISDSTQLGKWFLYSADADGIWDDSPRLPPARVPEPAAPSKKPSGPSLATASRPLNDEESSLVTKALAGRSVRAVLHSGERVNGGLVLRLRHLGVTGEEELRRAVRSDIVPATQAALIGDPTPAALSLIFLTCYRDKLGNVSLRPYETVRMERDIFAKIHFENLTLDETLQLFQRDVSSYAFDDVILWWKGSCGADGSLGAPPALAPVDPVSSAPAPSSAVADALRWIATHQSPDGGWECAGFGRWNDGKAVIGAGPEGSGKAQYDVGVTGLALLAFFGAGHGNRGAGPYSATIERGLVYLKGSQDAEGCFGKRSTGHYVYNHAIAALAMVEAYGRAPSDGLRRSAQQGLAFSEIARNPGLAWRYGVRPGDNDTSVTGWFALGFFRAREINAREEAAGNSTPFVFSPDVFAGARVWIGKMTEPETGRAGYQNPGTGAARTAELQNVFPAEKSESLTAIALLLRGLFGENAATSTPMRLGIALCLALPPVWSPDDGRIDMYYWHYATAALKRVGGHAWREWKTKMTSVAKSSQRTDTGFDLYKGSWDNVDPWGADGGRVYSTAMMTLCLEAASE